MAQLFIKVLCIALITITHASNPTFIRNHNLKEIESGKTHRQVEASPGCLEDTQDLDENVLLKNDFDAVLLAFSDSFNETNAWKYCTPSVNGQVVNLNCVVDYSSFDETSSYSSQCEAAGGINYKVSILMMCTSDNKNLEMDLKNIPQCTGKSCDSSHLYLALIKVLDGIKSSMGTGDDFDWECRYFHDFDAFANAPRTVLTVGEEEDGEDSKSTKTSKTESRAYRNGMILSLQAVVLIISSIFVI